MIYYSLILLELLERNSVMHSDRFSHWTRWSQRNNIENINYPGIYIIAISPTNLASTNFSWQENIEYIGMTNSVTGLKGRLQQFDNTIRGKRGHGGADRFRFKHRNYEELTQKLFVAVASFPECNISKQNEKPDVLRMMGKIAAFEYECLAYFLELFHKLPAFNNKQDSPKYSLTIGKGLKSPQ